MKTLIFDLDGTMYRGTSIIESAKTFLDYCIKTKIPFIFLTNNSMRSRKENVEHMLKMGYSGIREDMFYNSAMAACKYAKNKENINSAYYLGKQGIVEAMELEDIFFNDVDPDAVFIGLKKDADYNAYSKALSFLLNGAKLIGTNSDRILASPSGFEIGNGSIVTMFEYATGQKSPNIAKPYAPILEFCLDNFSLSKEDVILIGDNLETDIKLGFENGVETIFVQTGVHKVDDIENLKIYPTHTVETLTDLIDIDFFKEC